MEESTEQSIHVAANDYEEQGDDDINADEEINEVLEDDVEEHNKSGSIAEDVEREESGKNSKQTSTKSAAAVEQEHKEDATETMTSKNKDHGESKGENKETANKKLLRMQLSTQTLQKLLKEGKMEKLPTGSFRISADALKELKKDAPPSDNEESLHSGRPNYNTNKRKINTTQEDFSDDDNDDDDDDEEEEEQLQPTKKKMAVHKNKIPLSRNIKKISGKKDSTPVRHSEKLNGSSKLKIKSTSTSAKKSIIKKKNVLHDYVSDFNSSEDEDDQVVSEIKDSLAELVPTKPGRLTKPVLLLFEELNNAMFGNISEDDDTEDDEEIKDEEERIRQLAMSDPDFGAADSSNDISDIPGDFWMVGQIGNDDNTKMCIRSTGKRKTVDGLQYPVYNIDTGVGSVTTVTPLVVTGMKVSPSLSNGAGLSNLDVPDPDLVQQLNQKTVSLRKYKEQVKVLRHRYLKLARKLVSQPQLQTIGDLVAASSRFLTQDQLLFFTMQLKAGCDATQGARFSTREKMLAMALYQQHPDTYKWLHRFFHLPSTAVLERWLDIVARGNPTRVKQLMYHVYTRYCFRPRDDMVAHTLVGY